MSAGDYKKLILIFRGLMISSAIVLVVSLVQRDLVLSGRFSVEHDFTKFSPFFSELVPKQRVQGTKILHEPVYTTLSYPRPFVDLGLTVFFDNPEDLLVEFGPQVSPPESFSLKALNHPVLNVVFSSNDIWESESSLQSLQFFQKRSAQYRYASLEQLFQSLPEKQSVGYYGFAWTKPYLPQFKNNDDGSVIASPLKGGHQFYVATNKPDLNFLVDYQNINNKVSALKLELLDFEGKVLESVSFQGGEKTKSSQAELKIGDLKLPAVYWIKVLTEDDVFLQSIKTSAPFLVAKGRVSLAGGPKYTAEFGRDSLTSVQLITNARQWVASTSHRDTLQNIRLNQESLNLTDPFKEVTYTLSDQRRFLLDSGYPVIVDKGNVVLVGRGVFAFNQANYFSPTPWLIDHTVDIEQLGLDYVITDYQPPSIDAKGLYQQKVSVKLADVFAPERKLRWQISIPKLQEGQSFSINTLQADFRSEPVTFANAREKWGRFWKRELAPGS